MENESKMNNPGQQSQGGSEGNGQQKQSNIHRRGFASMDRDTQRRIASKGGREAHKQGVAHQWTSEQARVAGKKGGQISGQKRSSTKKGSRSGDEQE